MQALGAKHVYEGKCSKRDREEVAVMAVLTGWSTGSALDLLVDLGYVVRLRLNDHL